MSMYILLGLILVFVIAVMGFINFAPQFGAKASGKRLEKMQQSNNFIDGKFFNVHEIKDKFTFSDFLKFFPEMIKGGHPGSSPDYLIPVIKQTGEEVAGLPDTITSIIWFGHSALLLKIDGNNILLDPMFGDVPAPADFLGRSRFNKTLPISIEELPCIDAVLISHDHYDHLDYGSIIKLKEKVGHFYAPLGVGAHLEKWGILEEKISELYWWEQANFNGLSFISTPAQHFSGRNLGDRNKTLWTSWVIKGKKHRVFFSGDTGYFNGFKEIGDKYGPFDITLFECGQYNELWAALHSFPEETAQAHLDLKGKVLMPIHWGAFALSTLHAWDEPIKRISKIAAQKNIKLTTPRIGEEVKLDSRLPDSEWWLTKD